VEIKTGGKNRVRWKILVEALCTGVEWWDLSSSSMKGTIWQYWFTTGHQQWRGCLKSCTFNLIYLSSKINIFIWKHLLYIILSKLCILSNSYSMFVTNKPHQTEVTGFIHKNY
jgi:hypothetical protein